MIEIRSLSHGFLRKSLFNNVSLRLFSNERYGITGANGSGKSTLLKIIAQSIEPDSGEVDIQNDASIYSISQEHHLSDHTKIIDAAMMGKLDIYEAIKEKEQILKNNENNERLTELEEIINDNHGYRLKPLAQSILEGLGIKSSKHEDNLSTLSGGYKWRVFLAQALVKNPDILILDEPTNHLDITSIDWLEKFLRNYHGMIILVSHDIRFMNAVCTKILDIDFDTITPYTGNYSEFEAKRALLIEQKAKEIEAQEKEIAKKEAFIERFRAKASKARQAQSRIKQLERVELIEPIKTSRLHPKFKFDIEEPGSKEILEVKQLSKSYADKVILSNVNFSIKRGEKVFIIGPNGSGKSTLLKALAQQFNECQKSIKWGYNVVSGYFAQDSGEKIKASNETALSWLWQFCPEKPQSFVQGYLGRMLLSGDDVKKSTKNLSGGELGRLFLASIMLKKPNVLLLDEPTNHLDVESIESLTKALVNYQGTLITVSHDRGFIDQIANRIIEITPGNITEYLGNYSDFIKTKEHDYLTIDKEKPKKTENDKNNDYLDKKRAKSELKRLERSLVKIMSEVEKTEQAINQIEQIFLQENFFQENSFTKVQALEEEKLLLQEKLATLMHEWENTEQEIYLLS